MPLSDSFEKVYGALSSGRARNRQLDLQEQLAGLQSRGLEQSLAFEAQRQPLALAAAQQGLDMGGVQLQMAQGALARQPGLDRFQDSINQLDLAMREISTKRATLDFKREQFDAVQSYELNPMMKTLNFATVGSKIKSMELEGAFNDKLLEGMRTAKDHLQRQQDEEGSASFKASRDIDTLLGLLEQNQPGFTADTNTRQAALNWYLDKAGKGFPREDILQTMGEMLMAQRGQPEAAAGLPDLSAAPATQQAIGEAFGQQMGSSQEGLRMALQAQQAAPSQPGFLDKIRYKLQAMQYGGR